jgi:YlmC/YmxH family sporulation protein
MKSAELEYVFLSLSQLRQMEVIDINKGRRLGFISDLIFDDEFTKIEYIVIPPQGNIFSVFKRKEEVYIKWDFIKVIGVDIIIVDTKEKTSDEVPVII